MAGFPHGLPFALRLRHALSHDPLFLLTPPRGPDPIRYRSAFIDKGFSMLRRSFGMFAIVIAAALLPAVVMAEAGTSTIAGIVRDSSGAAIPGATVKIVNEASGESIDAITDGQGAYRVGDLPAGQYRVEAVLDGFDAAPQPAKVAADQIARIDVTLTPSRVAQTVVVTARRVEEAVQEVPIPVSVLSGELVANAGAFNVNRVKELIPSVQFYSSNPRNSSVTISGMDAPFGLTNDGIEPGVGLYIDGIFYARPAAAALDFVDVERVEVLRGPQGALFGKNTTAGAINVTSRRPRFTREADLELTYGSYDFIQAKGSLSGPLSQKVAGRVSFSGTGRDGFIYNTVTKSDTNSLNNLGVRGQLLINPSRNVVVTVSADHTRQRPDGYAQVIAGVAPTLRPANRQYAQIAADLHYTPPSFNAFDRLTDTDTPWQSNQDLGGASATIDWTVGPGRLTSDTTAWRYWNWDPSSDRDSRRRASDDDLGGSVDAAAVDAGGQVLGHRVLACQPRRRRIPLQPGHRFESLVQTGTGLGGRPLPSRAVAASGDARSARRIRLQPVSRVPEHERRALRAG